MADDGFVLAYKPPHGDKRLVPKHYLTNPALGFKAAPTGATQSPAEQSIAGFVQEPAEPDTTGELTTITEPGKRAIKGKEVTG